MYSYTAGLLQRLGFDDSIEMLALLTSILAGVLAYIAARFIIRFTVVRVLNRLRKSREIPWLDVLLKNNFFAKAAALTIPVIISVFSHDVAGEYVIWDIVVKLSLVVTILYVLHSLVKCVNDIYEIRAISKNIPLRGLLQVILIISYIVGVIIFISVILRMNPTALLGSLGAMTAIITLIFRDAILGFVAGIQLAANDMVRIGDVIEIPQRGIFGTVIEISLVTVKVEEFDNTIVSVPAYTLVSESFINRRGILSAGMRRLKRSFNIDATSIRIIEDGKYKTNIEAFRDYLTEYLKNHDSINKESLLMVRQLEAGGKGVPLEVYAFVNTTDWVEFENIQSDIFDHIYAVIRDFDLALYQDISSVSMAAKTL